MTRFGRAAVVPFACLWLIASGCTPAPATSNTPESGAPMPSSIVDPYLKIQSALAADSMDEVKSSAGEIATASAPLGAPAFKIGTAAAQLTSAVELPDARQKFAGLSAAIITYMDGLHLTPPAGVHIASCAETNQQWLQNGDAVTNPYDRSSTCGTLR
jgi:hypothetical protein